MGIKSTTGAQGRLQLGPFPESAVTADKVPSATALVAPTLRSAVPKKTLREQWQQAVTDFESRRHTVDMVPPQTFELGASSPALASDTQKAADALLEATHTLLARFGVKHKVDSAAGCLKIDGDERHALGRLARDCEAQGHRLLFSPAMLAAQTTQSVTPHACNIDQHIFAPFWMLDDRVLCASAPGQADYDVAQYLFRALTWQYPTDNSFRFNGFNVAATVRHKDGLDPVADILVNRAASLCQSRGLQITWAEPHRQAFWIQPHRDAQNPGSLANTAADLSADSAKLIFHPLALWALNAVANFDLAQRIVFCSLDAIGTGNAGQAEGHEAIHVHTAHVAHTLRAYHPYNAWLVATGEKDLSDKTYGRGYCRDEEITAIADLLHAKDGLGDWAAKVQEHAALPVFAATDNLLAEGEARLSKIKGWLSPHLAEKSQEVAKNMQGLLSKLCDAQGPLPKRRASTYYVPPLNPQNSVSMSDPNALFRDVLAIDEPNNDGRYIEMTLNGFYEAKGQRVDLCLVDEKSGYRLELPFYAKPLPRLVHTGLKAADPSALVELRECVKARCRAQLEAIEKNAAAQNAVYKKVDDTRTAFQKALASKNPGAIAKAATAFDAAMEELRPFLSTATRADEPGVHENIKAPS